MSKLKVIERALAVPAMAAFCAVSGLTVWGETYTWKGGTGSFATAENWTTSGGAHAVPSGSTADLAFPSGGTVTDIGTFAVNNMSLGGAVDLQFGASGGSFVVNGVISGAGSLKSTGNAAADCKMYLYGNNTFTGGYVNYGGQTVVGHNNCLGTGPATFLGNGKPAYCLYVAKDVTLPNDVTIGQATGSFWGGPIHANYKNLTFAGTVHYQMRCASDGQSCVRFSTGMTTHKGNVYLDDSSGTGFVCDGNVVFEKAILPEISGKSFGCQINGGTPTVTLKGSGNALDHLKWANDAGTFVFGAKNIFAVPKSIFTGGGTATTGNFFIDMGGFDQVVESVYDTPNKLADSALRRVSSATPAMLTMRASANRAFRGSFNGKVTLCWVPTGAYAYTIQGVESTTSEALIVSNGTVNVTGGASFPNVSSISVSPGAALSFASGCSCSTTLKTLVLGTGAGTSFALADGGTLMVDAFYTVDAAGVRTKLPGGGTYTSADVPALGANVTVKTSAGLAVYAGPNGGKWSVADNWEDKVVPGPASEIRVANGVSSIDVDVEAEITAFTAPTDTALTLAGSGKLVLAAGQVLFENAKELVVRCEIAGDGQLLSRGAGALKLEHANTYTGGTLRDTDVVAGTSFAGSIYVGDNRALGTGKVEMNAHAGLNVYAAVTEVANDISWDFSYATNPQFYSHLIVNGKTAFTGTLDFSKTRCARVVEYGSAVTYNNVILETTTSTSWDHILIAKMNEHLFSGKVSGAGVIGCDTYSNWKFSSASNDLYAVYFYGKTTGSLLESLVKDTFLDTTRIIFCTGTGAKEQSWRLHGHDQTVACAYDIEGAPAAHVHYISTDEDKPARLTMKGRENRTFAGAYKGPLTVCWNPVGAYTLTLDGAAHTTSGSLVVSNGTVNVTGGASFANLGGLEVAADATLSFAAGTSVKPNLAKLVLAEGASLVFADDTELLVDEFWTVDAEGQMTQQDPDRLFTTSDFAALQGVKVRTAHRELPTVPVTWTAGGADTALTTDANWSAKPNLASAVTVATFAQAGSRATATQDAALKGIVFGQVAPFELAGPGTISLYEEGISVEAPNAGSGTYTISAPLAISGSSAWTVAQGTTLELKGTVTGSESAPGAFSVAVSGRGAVDWYEAEGSTCAADFVFSNTAVNVYGRGFGTAAKGTLTFTDYPEGSSHVYLRNATIDQTVELRPQPCEGVRWGSQNFFNCVANTTNVFNGPINLHNNYVRFQCPAGACCIFAGGMSNEGYYYPVPLGAGTYVITNTPVKVGSWWSDTTGHTVIAVPGNEMNIHLGNTSANGVTSSIRLDVDNAVKRCKELYLSSEALFDLNGHDFTADALATGHASAVPEVTSATPATLFVTNLPNTVYHPVRFTGAASLVKSGKQTLFLTGVSTSTGTVEVVTGGALYLAESGSWCTASKVTVQAGAKLALNGARKLGTKTDLYLAAANTTVVELPTAGVYQPVHDLYIGGVRQKSGTWGATGSGAQHVDDAHFTGAGVLTVYGDSGTVLIFR